MPPPNSPCSASMKWLMKYIFLNSVVKSCPHIHYDWNGPVYFIIFVRKAMSSISEKSCGAGESSSNRTIMKKWRQTLHHKIFSSLLHPTIIFHCVYLSVLWYGWRQRERESNMPPGRSSPYEDVLVRQVSKKWKRCIKQSIEKMYTVMLVYVYVW